MVTSSVRQVNDMYNARLAAAGLPSCMTMRHAKECWAKESAARIGDSSAARFVETVQSHTPTISQHRHYRVYNVAALAHHSKHTSDKHYALDQDTVMQVSNPPLHTHDRTKS